MYSYIFLTDLLRIRLALVLTLDLKSVTLFGVGGLDITFEDSRRSF